MTRHATSLIQPEPTIDHEFTTQVKRIARLRDRLAGQHHTRRQNDRLILKMAKALPDRRRR